MKNATRNPAESTPLGSPSGNGTTVGSRQSTPLMTGSVSARSSTRRAIGPSVVSESNEPSP